MHMLDVKKFFNSYRILHFDTTLEKNIIYHGLATLLNKFIHAHPLVNLICYFLRKYFLSFKQKLDKSLLLVHVVLLLLT